MLKINKLKSYCFFNVLNVFGYLEAKFFFQNNDLKIFLVWCIFVDSKGI